MDHIEKIFNFNGMNIKLGKLCPFCNKHHEIEIPMSVYEKGLDGIKKGMLIQNAFPTLTPSQREFIKTGICDECWDNL